jgi:hypothetical protein
LFSYIDHLRQTRERYGDGAAQFELEHGLELRELRIKRANEAAERAKQGN